MTTDTTHAAIEAKEHMSDCSVHNGPAFPEGPCDCGAGPQISNRNALRKAHLRIGRQRDELAFLKAELAIARAERDEALAATAAEFNRGYVIACCNLQNLHDATSEACDVLSELGVTQDQIDAMDLSEYDAEALSEIRAARSDDPVSTITAEPLGLNVTADFGGEA